MHLFLNYLRAPTEILIALFFQGSKGKLSVLGSVHIFSDQYLDKEENNKVQVGLDDCLMISRRYQFKKLGDANSAFSLNFF